MSIYNSCHHCSIQMGIQMGLMIQMGLTRESSIGIWNGQNWPSPKIIDHKPPKQSKGDNMLTQTSFRRWNGCLPLLNPLKNLTFGVGHSHNNNNITWQLSWFNSTALYSSHIGQQQKMGLWTEAKLKTAAYYSKTRKGMNKQVEKKHRLYSRHISTHPCANNLLSPKDKWKEALTLSPSFLLLLPDVTDADDESTTQEQVLFSRHMTKGTRIPPHPQQLAEHLGIQMKMKSHKQWNYHFNFIQCSGIYKICTNT